MGRIGLWFYRNEGGAEVLIQLEQAVREFGHEPCSNFDLRTVIFRGSSALSESGFDLTSLDVLYIMNADEQTPHQLDVARGLESLGVKIVNPLNAFELSRDKWRANIVLRNFGVRVPESALIPPGLSSALIHRVVRDWAGVVVKKRTGHGGRGVLRFMCVDDLIDFLQFAEPDHQNFYLEEYVEFGDTDVRVDLVGGIVAGGYSRKRNHPFKTNVHAGAEMIPIFPLPEAVEVAQTASRALEIPCTIVDLVKRSSDGAWVVIEVNPMLGVFTGAGLRVGHNTIQSASDLNPIFDYDKRKIQLLSQYLARQCEDHLARR